MFVFFCKQKTADEMRISDWSSDVCASDLALETAEAMFNGLFFDSERYDLSAVGRVKMNARLGFETDDQVRTLRKDDMLSILKILVDLKDGRGEIDDIDHLGNRRVDRKSTRLNSSH